MIKATDDAQTAFDFAMRLINYRMRTRAEIITRLEAEGIGSEAVEQALGELERYGYVDDRKYAEMYIEERSGLRGYGIYKIRQELRQKGIPRSILEDALEETDVDQLGTAIKLLEVRLRRKTDMDKDEARDEKRRCFGYLQRRGYPIDVVNKALKEFF